ncbi:hypothetical protein Slin15195_G028890 [Septoria linicola]|uniref:Uncharacterized protein n=1 Tax=Septoria linicola TaxID=215465 RepID=A0A9Q9ANB2_9PEZI|nr:hypothetical protein Slin14017_G027920 [Septoria linicola]USW49570.1 hypothetical protein Slin15195_G028890 [Septoria linicola]
MAATALHLPEEILTLIVDYLRLPSAITIGEKRGPNFSTLSDSDRAIKLQLRTLAYLSRTSKSLYHIVKPVLYHTYPGFRIANARKFIKTLATVPGCADSVREIVVDKWEHVARGDEHPIDRAPQSLDTQCLQYARGLRRMSSCYPMGLGSAVGAELESGRADVVLTSLIMLCDNIEVLEVSVPCVDQEAHREEFMRARSLYFLLDLLPVYRWSSESYKRYQRIRRLAIRLEKHSGIFGCTFAKRLLMMPNVDSFSAWRISCSRLLTSSDSAIINQPWPGLRRIELRECIMDNVTLAYLLQRAPNLRDIDLHWAVQQYPLDFKSIAASLNTFGAGLQSVKLDTRNNFCRLPEPDPHLFAARIHEAYDDPLGNLERMTTLVHLAVTPRALIGSYRYFDPKHKLVDCLPVSLTTLQILGPTREDPDVALTGAVYRHLVPIMQDTPSTCSELRRISFRCAAYALHHSDVRSWRCDATRLNNLGPTPGFNTSFTKRCT